MKPDNPTLWLWTQLETLLSEPTIAMLRQGYTEQSKRYNRAAQLRQARRELAVFERIITTYGPDTKQYQRYAKRIATRKAKIAKLDDEENVT